MNRRSEISPTARDLLLEDLAAHALYLGRSLRQMVNAGHRYAMVPYDLASVGLLEAVLDELVEAPDPDPVCGALYLDPDAAWICLARRCSATSAEWPTVDPDAGHGWPALAGRAAAAGALLEQTDPIARIERRVAFALDPSTHPLLDPADMPTA